MTKYNQITGRAEATATNPRNDAQKGPSTRPVPELKDTPTTPTGLSTRPDAQRHVVQHGILPNSVAGRDAPNDNDSEHMDRLRSVSISLASEIFIKFL